MMRQLHSWVPIAPLLPLPSSHTAASSASGGVPRLLDWDRLGENDVLLRKGGRPTHGKVKYFRFLQGRANEYASYRSPIDRRLLARELVDTWLQQGGRFCSAVTVDERLAASASAAAATSHPVGDSSTSSVVFRVASTEEALQFTRRVLVRHFTPTMHKRNAKAFSKKDNAGPPSDATIETQEQSISTVPAEAVQLQAPCIAMDRPAAVVKDLELARTNEAADALCCLRSTARVQESPRPPARVSPTNHP